MYLISAEGYKNAEVNFLRIKKTGKNEGVQNGLGVLAWLS